MDLGYTYASAIRYLRGRGILRDTARKILAMCREGNPWLADADRHLYYSSDKRYVLY